MIHYLLCNEGNQPIESTNTSNGVKSLKLYRSFRAATKASKKHDVCVVVAFASRANALTFTNPLYVSDEVPELITKKGLAWFADMHREAKQIHPSWYKSSKERTRVEEKFNACLFGFDEDGRSIHARQYMSLSRKWCRYSAPIFINGKKATINTLIKTISWRDDIKWGQP